MSLSPENPSYPLRLGSSSEKFPFVADKSTWARRGIAVQNTIIEPGWRGYLTLEISNHSEALVHINAGDPIAQIIFLRLDHPTDTPYAGRYQDQPPVPVGAVFEKGAA